MEKHHSPKIAGKAKPVLVFHPFLFAAYAVLGMYSHNSMEVPVQWITRPLLTLLLIVAVTYYLLRRKTSDEQYSGLAVTLGLFWFFFGHFHRALLEQSSFWSTASGIVFAFAIWTIPFALLASHWAWNHVRKRKLITSFLNVTSALVIVMPSYVTANSVFQMINQTSKYQSRSSIPLAADLADRSLQPDIYLIILDAYGREDTLREIYDFDNSEFVEGLEQRGFYVADQSTSNYPQTPLSLSSLVNAHYLDSLTKEIQDTNNRGPVIDLLQHNLVRRSLQEAGYSFVALSSATFNTQIRDADVFYRMTSGNLNEFEAILLSSTVANFAVGFFEWDVPVPSYPLHRRSILFSLKTLEELPNLEGPKFVFAHITAPHPPFVFDEFGEPIDPDYPYSMADASGFKGTLEEYKVGYIGEVRFLNRRLMSVIDNILAHSAQPPIIILQGDHGPGAFFDVVERDQNSCLSERFSILNAYYFPDQDYRLLYESISPINSFRVILNQYFGARLALLDDRSYYASWNLPYKFFDVTEKVHLPCVRSSQ